MTTVADVVNAAGLGDIANTAGDILTNPFVNALTGGNSGALAATGQEISTWGPDGQAPPLYTSEQSSLLSRLPGQLDDIRNSAVDAAKQSGLSMDTALRTFGRQYGQKQTDLNNRGIQNEMARRAGANDILSMVSRGINSAGMMLGNRNAGTSSATGEIARAYGQLGEREMNKVGNQYALEGKNISDAQKQLLEDMQFYQDVTFKNEKESMIQGIVADATTQIQALNEALVGASLPDRIAIEAEKTKIKNAAQAELAKFDSLLANQISGVRGKQTDVNAQRTTANELARAGQAPQGMFNYTNKAPMGWRGQAPAGGNLPLFTFARGQRAEEV